MLLLVWTLKKQSNNKQMICQANDARISPIYTNTKNYFARVHMSLIWVQKYKVDETSEREFAELEQSVNFESIPPSQQINLPKEVIITFIDPPLCVHVVGSSHAVEMAQLCVCASVHACVHVRSCVYICLSSNITLHSTSNWNSERTSTHFCLSWKTTWLRITPLCWLLVLLVWTSR